MSSLYVDVTHVYRECIENVGHVCRDLGALLSDTPLLSLPIAGHGLIIATLALCVQLSSINH